MKLSFIFAIGPYSYGDPVISFDSGLNFFEWETGVKDLQVGI